ncbi:IS66 family insertion sequence element accessory protein TnpB [Roseomonas sp. WA12]
MIPVPSGVQVWLAVVHTDMRRGMSGLAFQIHKALGRDPHAGGCHALRDRRGNLVKMIWHDGLGMSGYAKRLERDASCGPRPRVAPPTAALAELVQWCRMKSTKTRPRQ